MHICRHLPSNYSCCFQQVLQLLTVGCCHLLDVGCCRVRLVRGARGVPASSRVLFFVFLVFFIFMFVLFFVLFCFSFCFFVVFCFLGFTRAPNSRKNVCNLCVLCTPVSKNKTPHCSLCFFCTPVSKNTGPKEKCGFCV